MNFKQYLPHLFTLIILTQNVFAYSHTNEKQELPLLKNTVSLNGIGHVAQHALGSGIQYERGFIKNKVRLYGNYSLGYFNKDSRSSHFQAFTFGFLYQPKSFGIYSFRIGHNVSRIDEYKLVSLYDKWYWGIGFKLVQIVQLSRHWHFAVDAQAGLYEGAHKNRIQAKHGSFGAFPAVFLQIGYSF